MNTHPGASDGSLAGRRRGTEGRNEAQKAVELGFVPNRGRGHHIRAAAPLPPCAKAICGSDYAPRGVALKWGPASRNYQHCFFFLVCGRGGAPFGDQELYLPRSCY